MTRRERLERKLEKRCEWAAKREAKAQSASDAAHRLADQIPPGQPILVGHHSEKRHRRHLKRIDSQMRQSVESSRMADHHRSKARGLESQLDRTIFSDDRDAIEQLEEKIQGLEASRERMKQTNAAWRKAGKPAPDDAEGWHRVAESLGVTDESLQRCRLDLARFPYHKQPFPGYALTNTGSEIRRAKQRIEEIRRRQDRSERAEASGGVVIEGDEWVRVTFAEKPDRSVLNALKAAGFRWGGGSWTGQRAKLPEELEQ